MPMKLKGAFHIQTLWDAIVVSSVVAGLLSKRTIGKVVRWLGCCGRVGFGRLRPFVQQGSCWALREGRLALTLGTTAGVCDLAQGGEMCSA